MPLGAQFLLDAAPGSERGARRREMRLAVETAVPGGTAPVVLHNLSKTGLLIETQARLPDGESFEVNLPEAGTIVAQVVWQSGDFYGCQFAKPISEGAVSAALLRAPPEPAIGRQEPEVLAPPPVWNGPRGHERPAGQLSLRAKFSTIIGLNLVLWTLIVGSAVLVL